MSEIAWYLLTLNAMRRFLGRPERRYLTDAEWKEYMRSIIPPARRGWLAKSKGPVPTDVDAALKKLAARDASEDRKP